jgi:hypothetical protein
MGFGDFASIAFVLIILLSFLWPFGRGKLGSRRGPTTGGPRDFAQSGGYTPVPGRTVNAAPVPTFQSPEESVHLARVEERLTRDEIRERATTSGAKPAQGERTQRRPGAPVPPDVRAGLNADHIRTQLRQRGTAQTAYVMKDVFDRPVGMRDGF